MTLLTAVGIFIQVIGFIWLCRIGSYLSDRLAKRSEWLAFTIGTTVVVSGLVLCVVFGLPQGFLDQTTALFCVAFGGGMVVRQHDRLFG